MAKTYRYSNLRPMTAFEASKAWRSRFKQMRERFETNQAEATAALGAALTTNITESGDIVARVAKARLAAEAKVKAEAAERLKAGETIDTSRADIKDSIFSNGSSGKLDSGTSIDLNAGTITLSSGKTIDIKTGARTVNLTV